MASLRDKNIAAFERHDPELAALIKGHRPSAGVVLTGDGDRADVMVNGVSFYDGNAKRNAVRHLARYLTKPTRLDLQYDAGFVATYMGTVFAGEFERLEKSIERGAGWAAPAPTPYTMLCMGVGLGFHLDAVLDRLPIRILYVTECNFDLFDRSLDVFDWDKFFDKAAKKSVAVKVFVTRNSHYAAYVFFDHVRRTCPPAVDGMYFYKHYEDPFFDQVQANVIGDMHWYLHQVGSFGDEFAQLENAIANLNLARSIRVVEPPQPVGATPTEAEMAAVENDLTAIVVGSGPSLKDSLAEIKALQGRAVIASAGSGLLPLLKAGIKPTFHVEVERDSTVFANHAAIRKKHDVDGITYVLPTTIDPGFLREFPSGGVFMFVRGHLSPAALLDGLVHPLIPSGPSADHAALGVVLACGMRRIVFVGNDYGSRVAGVHHVEGSIYGEDFFAPASGKEESERYHQFNLTTEGNFGTAIQTNFNFLKRKQAMEQAIKVFNRVRFFNASDGARIEDAQPLRRIRDLPGLSRDRSADIRKLLADTRDVAPDRKLLKRRLDALRAEAKSGRLSKYMRAADESAADGHFVFDAFSRFLADPGVDAIFKILFVSDINKIVFVHSLIAKHCPDAASRRKLDRAFLDAFAARFEKMEDKVTKLPALKAGKGD